MGSTTSSTSAALTAPPLNTEPLGPKPSGPGLRSPAWPLGYRRWYTQPSCALPRPEPIKLTVPQRNPDLSQRFDEAMNANTARDGLALAKSYNFSGVDTLADIGGGRGLLLASLLEAYPIMRGVLFDRPQVVAHAPSVLSAAGVSDRCTVIAGDFFEGVPPGASAYLLSHIVHDWADEDATRILRNCRIAGGRGGKVLVFERLIEPDSASEMSVLHIDLEMMVNVGGLERTKDQFQSVFSEAGLNLARVIPIAGTAGHVMLEGV